MVKLIVGIGEPLAGRLLHIDALDMRFREFRIPRDPDCPVCGENATITEPIDYEGFCMVPSASPPRRWAPAPERRDNPAAAPMIGRP